MIKHAIGINAGIIWELLNSRGELERTEIQEQTGLDSENLMLALGWLARENKIFFYEKKNRIMVCLQE